MEDSLYRVTAKAIIFNSKEHILMVEYDAGGWGLPGGGIEHGESPQKALIRECQEELGVSLESVGTRPVYIMTEDLRPSVWSCKLLYEAIWQGNLADTVLEEGIKQVAYLTIKDLQTIKLVGSGKAALEYLSRL